MNFTKTKYFLLPLILFISITKTQDTGIRLTAPALKYIDGIPGFVDKTKVAKMIWLGQQLAQLQYGVYNPKTKKREPQLEYKNNKYTLEQLVKLEKKDPQNPFVKELLEHILLTAKKNFEQFSSSFFKEARGSEQYMFDLIQESCEKRKRPNSLLKTWAKSMLDNHKAGRWYEGIEFEVLRQQVNTVGKLFGFCTDLTNFLKDLVRSCPKALHQYKEWITHQRTKNEQLDSDSYA